MAVTAAEQRTLTRIQLTYFLRVFDEEGNLLGHIADITTEGMRIVGEEHIEPGRPFNLWMEFPLDDNQREQILLQTESCWSTPDVNPQFYNSGFHLIDPPRTAVRRIREVIDDFTMTAV